MIITMMKVGETKLGYVCSYTPDSAYNVPNYNINKIVRGLREANYVIDTVRKCQYDENHIYFLFTVVNNVLNVATFETIYKTYKPDKHGNMFFIEDGIPRVDGPAYFGAKEVYIVKDSKAELAYNLERL